MRPRNKEIRRYKKEETGTRTFKIEELAAEIPSNVSTSRRGNVYVGPEFEGCDVIILVLRKVDYDTNNA